MKIFQKLLFVGPLPCPPSEMYSTQADIDPEPNLSGPIAICRYTSKKHYWHGTFCIPSVRQKVWWPINAKPNYHGEY